MKEYLDNNNQIILECCAEFLTADIEFELEKVTENDLCDMKREWGRSGVPMYQVDYGK